MALVAVVNSLSQDINHGTYRQESDLNDLILILFKLLLNPGPNLSMTLDHWLP